MLRNYPELNSYQIKRIDTLGECFMHLSGMKPERAIEYIEKELFYKEYLRDNCERLGYSFENLNLVLANLKSIAKNTDSIENFINRLEELQSVMEKAKFKNIVFLFSTLLICLIVLLNIDMSSIDTSLFLSALVNACFLITSVYCAVSTIFRSSYPKIGAYIIAIGMILFFLCDANVGIFNLTSDMQISFFNIADINFLSGLLMWFFYLPSQLMLSLSGFKPDYLKKVFEE
jgi:hypothetical protein